MGGSPAFVGVLLAGPASRSWRARSRCLAAGCSRASLFTPELKSAEMHVECNVDKELKVVGIQKDGKKIGCILWFCGERPGNSLDRKLVDIRIKDLDIEDPVYVDMLTGNVHDLSGIIVKNKREAGSLGFNGLPLWDKRITFSEKILPK